ncbi:MAG: hypothetical protein ACLGI7_14325 [Gammaproteobacteria bacterium]
MPERNGRKIHKDWQQGLVLLTAVVERMPHYPVDGAFKNGLPPALLHYVHLFERGALEPGRLVPHAE